MTSAETKEHNLTRTLAAPGEPFVWLTAMGLAIGLCMVAGLLGIIVANGLPVFWPSEVLELKLKPGVTNPVPNGGDTITGELVQKRTKRVPVLSATGETIDDQTEVQIYVGNKDALGINFVFVNQADIASISRPLDIYRIERMEYGIAFGIPREVKLAGGSLVAFGDPTFPATLARITSEAAARRQEIEKIEKGAIGNINTEITNLRAKGRGSSESLARIAALDVEYQILAAKARTLR
ncbi:MAG: hypothetical protein ACOVLK_01125, partial [Terrimicrobiaceae bacterium]